MSVAGDGDDLGAEQRAEATPKVVMSPATTICRA